MKKISSSLLLYFAIVLIAGCVDLQKVNDFSSASVKSIQGFESLSYSYKQASADVAKLECLNKQQLTIDSQLYHSELSNLADSQTTLLYNSIKAFFSALTNLSSNSLTTYKYDTLSKALIKAKFADSTANSYAHLANILTRAIADEYRKHHIKKFIKEAAPDIIILLNTLISTLDNDLKGRIETVKARARDFYTGVYDTTRSGYERIELSREYNSEIESLNNIESKISVYTRGLGKIVTAFKQLSDNIDRVSADDLKKILSTYISNINDIISEFNKLKK